MEINLNEAKCTGLSLDAPVRLAKDDDTGNGFLIEAYTGEVVERWYGKLAIEVDGITAKTQIPVLLNHDTDQIVGYSKDTYIDGSFYVSGKFSEVTKKGQETKALALEGFPWQASIGVRPKKILSLEKDSSATVNGTNLNGPAEVWLESEVFETSFVPLGADSNTSVATFSKFDEAPQGADNDHKQGEEKLMEITLELLEKDAPELLTQIQDEAKKAGYDEGLKDGAENEVARIKAVSEQLMAGHEDLIEKLKYDGKTTGPEAAVAVLAAEKKIRENIKEDLEDDAVEPVAQPAAPEGETLEDEVTEENFRKNKELVEEFGDWETYEAYKTAVDDGIVKIAKKENK